MVLSRAAALRGAFSRSTLRRATSQARTQAWRQLGRRTYASEHGAKKSSDLPWLIGSVVFTVPAATWLFGQGPTKGDHHGHHEEHEEKEEGAADEANEGEQESPETEEGGDDDAKEEKAESEDKPKDEGDEKPKDEGDEQKEDDSDDSGSDQGGDKETPETSDDEGDGPSPGSPGQINKNDKKGPGEQQKGERKATESKREKDSASDSSGAQHPYVNDSGKSKKGEGVTETAKIHGTVDTRERKPR